MKKTWIELFSTNGIDKQISHLLNKVYDSNEIIYPKKEKVLSLFNLIDSNEVKVVIIGQDPYHNHNQANGIAFSTSNEVKTPKSLLNIFKELQADININHFNNNDLSGWVKQGVLMINTCWTVEHNKPASHTKLGWEKIVIEILNSLNNNNKNIIYCLWGNYAKKVYEQLDYQWSPKIVSAHPSPLSYSRGFKNSKPFSKINKMLKELHLEPIEWNK